MVQKSIKELPRRFSELKLPDSNYCIQGMAAKVLEAIGKTPKKVLLQLREDSLEPKNFHYHRAVQKCFYRDDVERAIEYVTVAKAGNVPKLVINYEECVYPFLKPYLDYDAYDHLDLLFCDVFDLTLKRMRHNYDSGVFCEMQKYYLEHYEEADRIRLRIDEVKNFFFKVLEEKGFKSEYERAITLNEEGEPFYFRAWQHLDIKFWELMRSIHDDDGFKTAVKEAMYVQSEEEHEAECLEKIYSGIHATTCNIKRHCEVSGIRDALNEYFREHHDNIDKISIDLEPIKAYVEKKMAEQGHTEEYEQMISIGKDGFPHYRFHSYEMQLGFQAHLGDLHSDPEFLKIIKGALYIKN